MSTTKKLFAIVMSLLMFISVSVISASAEDEPAEYTITPFTNLTVTVSANDDAIIRFVPEETKTYIFTSYSESSDPYCSIVNNAGEGESADDSARDLNFALRFEFVAGETYYLYVSDYSEEPVTYDVKLECAHLWTDGVCDNCDKVCDHQTEDRMFNTCECGAVCECEDIELGDTVKIEINNNSAYFKFVPEEDGAYIISSSSEFDSYCYLYDSQYEELNYSDDYAGTYDFMLYDYYEAGNVYFFLISAYEDVASFDVTLSKAVHTVEGAEHELEYTEYTYGNCQMIEYTEGLYCAECDEYISGHIEIGYGIHEDFDMDNKCDICGEVMFEEPSLLYMLGGFVITALNFFKNFFLTVFTLFGIW